MCSAFLAIIDVAYWMTVNDEAGIVQFATGTILPTERGVPLPIAYVVTGNT
jgi:hypothetical protein